MVKYLFSFYLIVFGLSVFAQRNRISTSEYIEKYKDIAIVEMKRSGIPASITLAQGIIESASGNSTLAKEANNHFGIKCHKWTGPAFYQDDDARNECFRKYNNPEESYRDHTDFLRQGKRYAFLFDYKSNDYKNWAYGLKKAGYATNPRYPQDLIKAIEENSLHQFDDGDYKKSERSIYKEENFIVDIKRRKIFEKNRIKYIIAEKDDNIASLTKELDLALWQIAKYNELPTDYQPVEGELLYIQPKRNSAEYGYDFHVVKEGENMHSISQMYGIKLKKLYRKNRMEAGSEPEIGQKLWLRKRMPENRNENK